MVESRYVLYGLIAGFIAGVIAGSIPLLLGNVFDEMIKDVMMEQLKLAGAPQEVIDEALASIGSTIAIIKWIAPIASAFQMLLLGGLFGFVQDIFIRKFKLVPWLSAILSGTLYTLLLGVIPMLAISLAYGTGLIQSILKHLSPIIVFLPEIIYTALLTLFSAVEGPWSRIGKEEPSVY